MAITVSYPAGSRGTRLTLDSIPGDTISTHWNIDGDATFTVVTKTGGSATPNVLSADLSTLNIWLPPSHSYTVRTRHNVAGSGLTAWTNTTMFTSRGPLNSYEKYLALSGIAGVDNIDAQ
jgi:hypothetical protein